MQRMRWTGLAITSLAVLGACSEQSVTSPTLRPVSGARFDLAAGTSSQFCSDGSVTVSGPHADGNAVVVPQANVPWTGTGTDVGSATASWLIPEAGANVDWYDNEVNTFTSPSFTVPTGYTATLSGLTLRDNSVRDITLTNTSTLSTIDLGGETDNNSKSNFGAAGFSPTPLAFGTGLGVTFPAGTYTVSFALWNEDLLNDPGNHGIAYPGAGRGAPNPTGIIYCFTVTPTAVPTGNQGCSPGYYKTHTFANENLLVSSLWTNTGYAAGTGPTLKEALSLSGGPTLQDAKNTLLRQAAAAYANIERLGSDYPLTLTQLNTLVNNALASGNRTTILNAANTLNTDNNLEGPRC